MWGRAIAGTVDNKHHWHDDTIDLSNYPIALPSTGTQTCNTTTRQDYTGFQVGHDISILNGGGTGANWHFGVTAGYFEAKTKDITPAGAYINPDSRRRPSTRRPGTFSETRMCRSSASIPPSQRVTCSSTARRAGISFRTACTDVNNGLFGQQLDARGFSLTGNAGYNIPLHRTGSSSRRRRRVVACAGRSAQCGRACLVAGGGVRARGHVCTIDDIDSVLGRASVRVGTNFTHRTGRLAAVLHGQRVP